MTARRAENLTRLLSALLGAGIVVAIVTLVPPPHPAIAQPDPVVATDHAPRTDSADPRPVYLVNPPAVAFRPTRWAQFLARSRTAGKWTGGWWLASALIVVVRAGRKRWASWRRGWRDHITGSVLAACGWAVASIPLGATLEVTLTGMLGAAAAGTLVSMVPGEKQPKGGEAAPT
jgi:hypothetical protein